MTRGNGASGPVRVVVVTHTGQIGGAERALLRLCAASDARFAISLLVLADGPLVAAAREQGVAVQVIDGGEVSRVTRAQSASPIVLLSRLREGAAVARRVKRAVSGADLVVANSLKAAVLLGAVRPRRWVWHLHDRIAADYLPRPAVVALRLLARVGPRRIVANSAATAATVSDARGRLVVAYPGIERAMFARPRPAGAGGPVGILGRVAPTKGQRELVQAAAIVARAHPTVSFRVVGAALFDDADYGRRLAADIAASPVADRIAWDGWSDDPGAALRGFGVFVHASPVPEPFGQVIVEAMAAGVPVVATDAGGVAEILSPDDRSIGHDPSSDVRGDGVRSAPAGLLVRPGDAAALARAICIVLDDPAGAELRAARARELARERFTIDQTWSVVARAWLTAIG